MKRIKNSDKRNLPVLRVTPQTPAALMASFRKLELTKGLPPATIVYGSAAGAFFAFAFYLFVMRHWLDGFLTLLPAGCFVGFAVHLMKHGQTRR